MPGVADGDVIPLSRRGDEALVFAAMPWCGWASYWPSASREPAPTTTLVKVAQTGQRQFGNPFVVTHLYIYSRSSAGEGGRLDGESIRTIPFARLEAALNRSVYAAMLNRRAADPMLPGDDPPPTTREIWAIKAPELENPLSWLKRPTPTPNPKPPIRFNITEGKRPDKFYSAVADAFLWLTAAGDQAAAPALAEANHVPPTTVYRWLKEARERGVLSLPGRSTDMGGPAR